MSVQDNTETIVATFKSPDDLKFQKPDHDPHGETCASAAHSSTSCDECSRSGLVATTTLELASGCIDGRDRDIVCSDCAPGND